jgi:hypothetical protein
VPEPNTELAMLIPFRLEDGFIFENFACYFCV